MGHSRDVHKFKGNNNHYESNKRSIENSTLFATIFTYISKSLELNLTNITFLTKTTHYQLLFAFIFFNFHQFQRNVRHQPWNTILFFTHRIFDKPFIFEIHLFIPYVGKRFSLLHDHLLNASFTVINSDIVYTFIVIYFFYQKKTCSQITP